MLFAELWIGSGLHNNDFPTNACTISLAIKKTPNKSSIELPLRTEKYHLFFKQNKDKKKQNRTLTVQVYKKITLLVETLQNFCQRFHFPKSFYEPNYDKKSSESFLNLLERTS